MSASSSPHLAPNEDASEGFGPDGAGPIRAPLCGSYRLGWEGPGPVANGGAHGSIGADRRGYRATQDLEAPHCCGEGVEKAEFRRDRQVRARDDAGVPRDRRMSSHWL